MTHIATSWLLAGLALAGTASSAAAREDPYGRALDRALERAQSELVAEIEVWRDHSTWADPWVVRSEHFELRTTHSRQLGLQLCGGLEIMLGRFQSLLDTDYEPTRPFRVDVFPSLAEYNQFGQTNGAEHSSFYGSFYTAGQAQDQVATYYVSNHTLLSMWITHGVLHQFLAQALPARRPVWIEEGLASYFALFWDIAYGVQEIDRLRGAGGEVRFLPLRQLMSDPLAAYATDTHNRFMELGMLFNYLIHHRGDTREVDGGGADSSPFVDYLRQVLRGNDPRRLDLHGLFTVDLDLLESDFRAFEFPR